MENPIKVDDLGVPLFSETSKCDPLHILRYLAAPTNFRLVVLKAHKGFLRDAEFQLL